LSTLRTAREARDSGAQRDRSDTVYNAISLVSAPLTPPNCSAAPAASFPI
jgi:hypothetical protein